MKRENLHAIFFGLLFIFVDFTVDGKDLIPDFVGYIFIAVGLNKLSLLNLNFEFDTLKFGAIILSFWSFYTEFSAFNFYNSAVFNIKNFTNLTTLFSLSNNLWFLPYVLFTLNFHIFKFILFWHIYKVVSEVATESDESGNQRFGKIVIRRKVYNIKGVLYSGAFVCTYGSCFVFFLCGLSALIPIDVALTEFHSLFFTIIPFIAISIIIYTSVVLCLLISLIIKNYFEIK